jgi:HAD superfamily hydrolase (TIGR01509 family)
VAVKATIFDCDGTLVDSELLANEVLVGMAGEHGLALSVEAVLEQFLGGKMAHIVVQIEARLGNSLPEDFVPRLREHTSEAFRARLRPVEGAVDLVLSLTGPICVASSGPPEKIRLSLSLTALLPSFEGSIFSSYEIGSWKPDAGLFLHAARVMGVEPESCAVVEDSLPGIRSGIAAEMKVFAFQLHGADPEIPPGVVVVKRLSDLQPLLA